LLLKTHDFYIKVRNTKIHITKKLYIYIYIYEHIQADVYWLLSDKTLVFLWQLHEVYCRVCKRKNILAVDQAEFLSLCQLVETTGILKVQGRKEARLSRVSVIHLQVFYIQSIGSKRFDE